MSQEPRIGVYVCQCGSNIAGVVDCQRVAESAAGLEGVAVARASQFTCSGPGQSQIVEDVRSQDLNRLVIAACSPHMHEATFQRMAESAGINRYQFVMVNIREHCSWVHQDGEAATRKAIALVKAGVARARHLIPLEDSQVQLNRDVAVIGGGIAGITAALQLADRGYKVHMIERSPTIGGAMAKLSKTFPTLDCSPCILSPKMVDIGAHRNIHLYTLAELSSISGAPGRYELEVYKRPRFVDPERCTGCGECANACPVSVKSEFDEELYERKAAFKPFPQSVPASFLLDSEHCVKCGACVTACPRECIELDAEPETLRLEVGAIIVATGFDLLDLGERYPEYHSEHPDVITSMQMERIMVSEASVGKVPKKRSNGKRVKDVAFVLCAGSRDPERGVSHCSKVCCSYAIKQAIILRKTFKYMRVRVHYIDIRTSGKGFEEFYKRAQDEYGVKFIRGKVAEIQPTEDGGLEVLAEDTLSCEMLKEPADMVILCPAVVPSEGLGELAGILKVPLGPSGFIAERHPKLDPVRTFRTGIYAAGNVLGPKDVHDSVEEGKSSAAEVMEFLGDGTRALDPIKAGIDAGLCTQCGKCTEVCPESAIDVACKAVDGLSCIGCGACVPECQYNAIDVAGYGKEALAAEIEGLLDTDGFPRLVGIFGDSLSYIALDSVGVDRLEYGPEFRIIRVPTTARIGPGEVLAAFKAGADGILLSEDEGSEAFRITRGRLEGIRKAMAEEGIEAERLELMPMLLPVYPMMPRYIETFSKSIKKLGPRKQ